MNKKIIIITLILTLGVLVFFWNNDDSIENDYYSTTFSNAIDIYAGISGMLMIEQKDELYRLREKVENIEVQIRSLETNRDTEPGEEVMKRMLQYAYEAIDLKQDKFNKLEMTNNEGIYEKVDIVAGEFRALGRIITEKGIETK
ncbi:hypothetical protein IZY60_15245 [Lutibacter sp. B2]|nr:hypothetical protein [Lutibacter sp. B2]